jgi:hypothetical protein
MESLTKAVSTRAERLFKLGLTEAAANLKTLLERKRKLALAYEHYRFVTSANIVKFQRDLREATERFATERDLGGYQRLLFESISDYAQVPPDHVLASLETAQERGCFDFFCIASIQKVKDPLLFGRIDGCDNLFYIDGWDDDVSIGDLLKENEG